MLITQQKCFFFGGGGGGSVFLISFFFSLRNFGAIQVKMHCMRLMMLILQNGLQAKKHFQVVAQNAIG